MGAWGTGNWENDDALDWVAELRDVQDVEAMLSSSLSQAGTCCRALAAAEVVAACLGRPGPGLPVDVEAWIAQHRSGCPPRLGETAAEVVDEIGSRSELQKLFDEGARNESWHAVLDDLRARLSL